MDTLDIEARARLASQVAAFLGTTDRHDPRFRAMLARAIAAGRFVPPTPKAPAPTREQAPRPPRRRKPRTPRGPRYVTPDGVKRPKPPTTIRVPQRVTLMG